jgi:glycosyltransferase involved in cell wall biosynthesis
MPAKTTIDEILLAQIEEHRTEVFYNLDPITFPGDFVRRLPSSVRAKIAWRAAPSGNTDFRGYDCMVCNFPSILQAFQAAGLRTAYLWPAFDNRLAPYAATTDRPIDIAFVGSFSRHHMQRTKVLRMVADLAPRLKVALHLETSRFTRLAEFPLWRAYVPAQYRRPAQVRRVAKGSLFGRDLYQTLSQSKIVINASIDMAGVERGNIRCFEAMATGALLLSDDGMYPPGMIDNDTICIYRRTEDIPSAVHTLMADPDRLSHIAAAGSQMLQVRYSKAAQWEAFKRIVAGCGR